MSSVGGAPPNMISGGGTKPTCPLLNERQTYAASYCKVYTPAERCSSVEFKAAVTALVGSDRSVARSAIGLTDSVFNALSLMVDTLHVSKMMVDQLKMSYEAFTILKRDFSGTFQNCLPFMT